MRLVYKATGKPVTIGDAVTVRGQAFAVDYFTQPHKPNSEGKVTLLAAGSERPFGTEFYVGIIGAEWIEREDRPADARWNIDLTSDTHGISLSMSGVPADSAAQAEAMAMCLLQPFPEWRVTGTDRVRS